MKTHTPNCIAANSDQCGKCPELIAGYKRFREQIRKRYLFQAATHWNRFEYSTARQLVRQAIQEISCWNQGLGCKVTQQSDVERQLSRLKANLTRFGTKIEREIRLEGWERQTPEIYQLTDIERLPCREASTAVLGMKRSFIQPGVLMAGPTGSGKTRTGYLLLKQWVTEYGYKFRVIKPREIRDAVVRLSKSGAVDDFIEELQENSVLFIDDLGHGTFSPAFAEALLEIVERFTAARRPLVVSIQTSGVELVRQWSKDEPTKKATAQAIVRRLGEFCRPVIFRPSDGRRREAA